MSPKTVAIIENHPVFCKGLTQLISAHTDYSVIGNAANCTGAIALVLEKCPDLVIVDLSLGDEDGLDLIKNLKALFPTLVMLVLSMHDGRYYTQRVLKAGARGYIMKEEDGMMIIKAIHTVMSGKTWVCGSGREEISDSDSGEVSSAGVNEKKEVLHRLTDRQLQILTLIGKGFGTVEIAGKLNLSVKTIGTHKEHIKVKLGCPSIHELRQLAIQLVNN